MSAEQLLHAAYSAIRGREMSKRYSGPGFTLDHLLQERVDEIETKKLSELDQIEKDVDAVVKAMNESVTP